MGEGALASGVDAVAFGSSKATGDYSTALGLLTEARGFGQVVVGQYNQPQGDPEQWVASDDLFVVGNGASDTERSNAFVVKKDGTVRIEPRGDLSMGEFTYDPDAAQP